jgi:Lipid A 3-O-deacylase (PagL)
MSIRIIALLPLLFPISLAAQKADSVPAARDPFQFGGRLHRGFIIPHSRAIFDVSHSNPYGLELTAQWLLSAEKYTRRAGLVARRGFSAYYFNFDNPEILGHCVSATPFIEPLIRPWKRLYASLKWGLGLAYVSKVYNAETNPGNQFFSTHLSLWATTDAHVHFKINPRWESVFGFNYNHISNAGMKEPNKGMNFPCWNAGLNYIFHPVVIRRPLKNGDWRQAPRNFFYTSAIGTLKSAVRTSEYPDSKLCVSYGILVAKGRRLSRMNGVSAGSEWVRDGFAREELDRQGSRKSALKGSLLLGHELIADRVRFTTHFGVYVFNPSGDLDPVYQRYGLFYRAGRHLLFGATLKAHRHVADVADVRVGWMW